jgi:hypothetical protein
MLFKTLRYSSTENKLGGKNADLSLWQSTTLRKRMGSEDENQRILHFYNILAR